MKKNLFLISFFIAGILYFSSCKPSEKDTPHSESSNIGNTTLDSVYEKAFERIVGAGITGEMALRYTKEYSDSVDSTDAKSVYFAPGELDGFLKKIKENGLCAPEKLGVRIYFAKYPAESGSRFPGKNSVILRATCDGKDIPHKIVSGNETLFVAYNFGDVCPPRCKPGDATADVMKGGYYRIDSNCTNCSK
jgi:hypothetical protein